VSKVQTEPSLPQTRWRSLRTIVALILREMSATYGRSPGGYAWAILQPVATILILAAGFSLMLRAPPLGTSFLLFYASAVLPLRLFQELTSTVGTAILFNRTLMGYPRVTFVDAILSRAILCILTQIMVNFVILTALFLYEDIREIIDPGPILVAFGVTIFLGFGIGVLNCFLSFAYPVWKTVWTIVSRPLLLISGVFYTFEHLPKIAQDILWYNPIIHITGQSRIGFYSTYDPQYISLVYILVFGLIPMMLGTLLLWRFGKDILQK
jgi:capsular polysaccharide transport system permease protein